jgi:hypothetical protein
MSLKENEFGLLTLPLDKEDHFCLCFSCKRFLSIEACKGCESPERTMRLQGGRDLWINT